MFLGTEICILMAIRGQPVCHTLEMELGLPEIIQGLVFWRVEEQIVYGLRSTPPTISMAFRIHTIMAPVTPKYQK
jgi:hypothetical protein